MSNLIKQSLENFGEQPKQSNVCYADKTDKLKLDLKKSLSDYFKKNAKLSFIKEHTNILKDIKKKADEFDKIIFYTSNLNKLFPQELGINTFGMQLRQILL
nr:hypothetical protein [Campylobacter sp.]